MKKRKNDLNQGVKIYQKKLLKIVNIILNINESKQYFFNIFKVCNKSKFIQSLFYIYFLQYFPLF